MTATDEERESDDSDHQTANAPLPNAESPKTARDDEFSQDTIFQALSNRRRRYVVYYCLHLNSEVELRELSRRIAAWENEKSFMSVTSEERRRVYNALQQCHLPKMDSLGIVEYDSNRNVIKAVDEITTLRPYLEYIPGTAISWCLYYLVLGITSAVLAATVVTGGALFGMLSGGKLALVSSILLVGSAMVHAYTEQYRRSKYEP